MSKEIQIEEKAIEEMAKVIDEFTEPLSARDIHKAEFSEQFAEHLYNADYRKQKWISVEDRLPTYEDGKVHCSQIDELPRADVVPKSEIEQLITLNSQLEAQVFEQQKEIDLLKSTITHKEEEAYTKGYADAKADILEKLQAEVERAETIAKYGDDFYEGKAEGVNAAMNCILSEGEG